MSLQNQPPLKVILEALIFTSGRTLGTSDILETLQAVPNGPRPSRKELEEALAELEKDWEARVGGIGLVRVAEGFEFRSRPEYAPWIRQLNRPRPQRLSVPGVETLALIAYRQPITRSEIEDIRGVDSGGVLKSLSDRRLIRIVGRKEEPGRPLLYATAKEFLEFFGLQDLSELPPLKEFEEMVKSQATVTEGERAPLTVADLMTPADEIEVAEGDDRDALDELDARLKNLKEIEKAASRGTALTDVRDGSQAAAGPTEATPKTEPSGT